MDQNHNSRMENLNDSFYRLTDEEKKSVNGLRARVKDQLTPRYDTDYNLYRWIKLASRTSKPKAVLDSAEKMLRIHLQFRHALNLDSDEIPNWDENPLFVKRILPQGFPNYMPSNNMYMWWADYSEVDVEGILSTFSSRDILIWHLWKFEHILRLVNKAEKETGALSGILSIMDVKNFNLTHSFMSAVKSGHLNYTAHFLHYENYPELVLPVNVINISKLRMLPYKLVHPLMPNDFKEKFRVYDSNFKSALLKQMTEHELPVQLGGKNPRSDQLVPIQPQIFDPSNYYQQRMAREGIDDTPSPDQICILQLPVRKRKVFAIECPGGSTLNFRIQADAELIFGIYFAPLDLKTILDLKKNDKNEFLEKMEMVCPSILVVTKVPDKGSQKRSENGTYFLLFCNKLSWLCRRNVQAKIDIDGDVVKDLIEVQGI